MSRIANLTSILRKTSQQLVQIDKQIAEDADNMGLILEQASLAKFQRQLEREFLETTAKIGYEVCSYRVFGEKSDLATNSFSAFVAFQRLFTITYSAINSGPKKRYAVSQSEQKDSSFSFSHSFDGSLGAVFTLPKEQFLFEESAHDQAMVSICKMAKVTGSQNYKQYAQQFGLGVIRELYKWITAHADNSLGADIDWRRGEEVKAHLFIQPKELQRAQLELDAISDEEVETFKVTGTLLGADVQSRTFHFKIDDGTEVRGKFRDAISDNHAVEVPHRHYAVIRKTSTIKYSTEEEKPEYFLETIESVLPNAT